MVKLVWWRWILLTLACLKSCWFLHQSWMRSMLGRVILVVDFSLSVYISCHSLLACRVSAERSTVKCMGFPVYVTCCFSLAAVNILSLCLVFVWLVCVLACFSLGSSCMELFAPLGLDYFLFHFGEIFNYSLFKHFLILFLFLFFFWDPYPIIWMLVCLILSQRSRRLFSVIFSFFLLYSALQKLFPPFYLPVHWFILLLQILCYWFLLEIFNFSNCLIHLCMFII